MSARWTEEEKKIVREQYQSDKNKVYTMLPNRGRTAIQGMASKLGVADKHRKHCKWTDEDIKILKETYARTKGRDPRLLKDKSLRQIRSKAHGMGLTDSGYSPYWTDEDKAVVLENYGKVPVKELEQMLEGRHDFEAITALAYRTRKKTAAVNGAAEAGAYTEWTEEEVRIVREIYPEGLKKVYAALKEKRSLSAIYLMAKRLGIAGRRKTKNNKWSRKDIDLLKRNYEKMKYRELEELFKGRFNIKAIKNKAYNLGLTRGKEKDWRRAGNNRTAHFKKKNTEEEKIY